jgi:ribosome-associated protein
MSDQVGVFAFPGLVALTGLWYNNHRSIRRLQRGESCLESSELAKAILDVIADKKGSDIVMLDLRALTPLADYFVVCSTESVRQLNAIADGIEEKLTQGSILPLHVEGVPESGWVILDYGSVIVHIFDPEQRAYYRLEKLWSLAPTIVHIQ